MKYLLFALFTLFLAAFAQDKASAADADYDGVAQFAVSIEDLPLMPGMKIVESDDVLFTTKTGKIAQTTVKGNVDIDEVYKFYAKSLPQLGWRQVSAKSYERGDERLSIDATSVTPSAATVVRFSVISDQ